MNSFEDATVLKHFATMPDPRVERTKRHGLQDILVLALCGALCDIDNWVELEWWAEQRLDWFRKFLRLPNGIPSHDTFGRVFAALDPEAFGRCFTNWTGAVARLSEGEVVAIDGKTVRHSFDKASGKAAIHVVSAWASQNRLVLGQVKTEEKSNEITAIPKLLECLYLQGCIVTLDAMGAQRNIVREIVDKGADYVISLKGNQGLLQESVEALFEKGRHPEGLRFYTAETTDGDHGRIEVRRCTTASALWMDGTCREWVGLTSFGKVESERTLDGTTTTETRYFIASLSETDPQRFLHAVRTHWAVENELHWSLDMTFGEDASRVRKDFAPENVSLLRRLALSLLKQHPSVQVGSKTRRPSLAIKRKLGSWNPDFLLQWLGFPKAEI